MPRSKIKPSAITIKAKPFSSFARALLRGQDFCPPLEAFPKASEGLDPRKVLLGLCFPPRTPEQTDPLSLWQVDFQEAFSGMSSCSLPQPSSLWPQTEQISLHPQMNVSKVHLKWDGHDRQQLSLQAWRDVHLLCHIAVVLLCGSELRFKTSRLLDKNNNRNKGIQSCMLLGAGWEG